MIFKQNFSSNHRPRIVPAANQSGNIVMMAISALNLLATIAMVAILYLSFKKEKEKQIIDEKATQKIESSEHGEGEKSEHGEGRKSEHGEGSEGEGEAKHEPAEKSEHGEHGEGGEGAKEGEKGSKKSESLYGKMIALEQFTVNLSTISSVNPKFVRANISIEAPTEDIEKEVTIKMPQVKNTIIDLFNSKKSSDLATVEGRDRLKEEILSAINSYLVSGKIKGVYFTTFALSG